jgi:hypothetical protein
MTLAGFSTTDITPDRPQRMSGWGFQGRWAVDQPPRDRLLVRALALRDENGRTAMLISTDLLGMTTEHVADVAQTIRGAVPGALVLVNHSHTHSGPATGVLRDGSVDSEYLETVTARITQAAIGAVDALAPCTLRLSRGSIDIAVNRRVPTPEGITMGEHEDGLCERDVWLLRVDDAHGHPVACWFSLAAHPIVLGPQNLRVSADWPGAAISAIEARIDAPAVFAQGCCGDNNPRGTAQFAGSIDEQDRSLALIAESVADVVSALWSSATVVPPTAFTAAIGQAHLPTRSSDATSALRLLVQGITIAESVLIVGLNAEPFAGLARAVRKIAAEDHTIVLGYTNGCFGYLPDDAAFAFPPGYNRGYEIETAPTLYGTDVLAPESVPRTLATVRDVMQRLA